MRRALLASALGALAALPAAGCGHHEFEPPDREARVREAAAAYTPALFDTIAWDAGGTRGVLGNQVYVDKCRTCHGPLGDGATEYSLARGLEVPSLTRADWPRAHDDSLRRVISVGHVSGMPVFGAHGLTPREIDAVTGYILDVLRPDVLGS
jgi:mono/diheme cytochrome c family protein